MDMTYKYKKMDLLRKFLESEKTSGYLLLGLTLISIMLANSSCGNDYIKLWHKNIDLSFASLNLNYSIELWINDGLMAIFFLLVGLEIKRELFEGELSTLKKAGLPAIAALGGMIVPALIHYAINAGTPAQRGFGIPMATDIAFSLGVLSILGRRVPVALKIFLTALAIIDDLGAIIIIALFYTSQLSVFYLILAISMFIVLLILNKCRIDNIALFIAGGIIMWYVMLESGVHATIAGVLLAFTIPTRKRKKGSMSELFENWLDKPVAFFILPLFALANTAILLPENIAGSIYSGNSMGIIAGLALGKFIGVFSFTYAAVRLGIGVLPEQLNWKWIAGAGVLAGIGFTMSIFITNLAFTDTEIITASKLSIIIASVFSAVFGLIILSMIGKNNRYERIKKIRMDQ